MQLRGILKNKGENPSKNLAKNERNSMAGKNY